MNYPTQKGVGFRLVYAKGRSGNYTKEKVGAMLLPNGFHAQKCQDTISRRFPSANAFCVYDQHGENFFCGSLDPTEQLPSSGCAPEGRGGRRN